MTLSQCHIVHHILCRLARNITRSSVETSQPDRTTDSFVSSCHVPALQRVPNREHVTSCLSRILSSYFANNKLCRHYKEQAANAFRKIIDFFFQTAVRTALKFVGKWGVFGGRNWCECGGCPSDSGSVQVF